MYLMYVQVLYLWGLGVLLTLPTSLGSDGRLVHLVLLFVCLFVCYQNQNYALVVVFLANAQVVPGSAATALASCPVPDQLRTNQTRSLVILFLRTTK